MHVHIIYTCEYACGAATEAKPITSRSYTRYMACSMKIRLVLQLPASKKK